MLSSCLAYRKNISLLEHLGFELISEKLRDTFTPSEGAAGRPRSTSSCTSFFMRRNLSSSARRPLSPTFYKIEESLVVIGLDHSEAKCEGFTEFGKMWRKRLTWLSVMDELSIPNVQYNMEQIHSEASKHLGLIWFPGPPGVTVLGCGCLLCTLLYESLFHTRSEFHVILSLLLSVCVC